MIAAFIYKWNLFAVVLFVWSVSVSSVVCAQKILTKSEKKRPVWLVDAPPTPANATFYYQITEGKHANLEDAKRSCVINLFTYIKQTNRVVADTKSDISIDNDKAGRKENESYLFTFIVQGEEVSVTFRKEDEYWEHVVYPNGEHAYHCYMLFAVGAAKDNTLFEPLTFSRKYGFGGVLRSMIIPGWGQIYKGSVTKGGCILGGEVLLVGGALLSENLRSAYVKKMREDPRHLKAYHTKADNWGNIRNVCIGGAVALYVYNLIDAWGANGRKRSITRKSHFVLSPTTHSDCSGVALTFNY